MGKVNIIALYIGVAVGTLFILIGFLMGRSKPKLNQVVVVVLSTTGATVGVNLGYLALTLEDQLLGQLADQRIPIVLGALAVIWTSIETLITTFKAASITLKAETKPPNP